MKIALVSDWFLPRLGGIELQVRDLAIQLRSEGHEPEVITPVPGPSDVDGIPVHRLGAPRLPGAGIVFTSEAFERLGALYAAGRYDLAHVHFGIIAPAAYGAAFIAQDRGIPTVATFHSVLRHFDAPLWLVRGAMGVADWRVKWAAVSTVVAEAMRPLVAGAQVAVIPNGIDAGWWRAPHPHADRAPGTELQLVSVMRLHRRKRPLLLLDAVRAARDVAGPGCRVHLAIVGDGPERYAMERAIVRAGLSDVVHLAGWLPQDAVRAALHRSDLFLLPSRLEAFGIAALEARCAGVPIVAMGQSGARDFLTDGVDSVLADDDAGFVARVARLASSPGELAALRRNCAAPVASCDWQAVTGAVTALYGEAANDCASAVPALPA